ncbi:hypothetical protein MHK_000817, partial [Candidatus Magnetomorum sp. HK-1]
LCTMCFVRCQSIEDHNLNEILQQMNNPLSSEAIAESSQSLVNIAAHLS